MTRSTLLSIAALVVALVVGAGRAAADVSPGPLAKGHAALEGVDNCTQCHSGGDAVSASKCLACHKALDQRIAAKAGYHAGVGKDCASCHPDHRGVDAALVKWPGGGRDKFDHGKLAGYKLEGGHAKVDCRKCHTTQYLTGSVAAALSAEERPKTYLGLGTTCAGCHKDVHQPTLGSDCQRCHDTTSWRTASSSGSFDHAKTRYPLVGKHASVDCTKCHGGTTQKLDDLHPEFATCTSASCHKDPHAGAMGTAANACTTCHKESGWADLTYARKKHAPKTLPLAQAHAKPKCAACHGAKIDKLPKPACVGCHADPHKPSLGTQCGQCHQATKWIGGDKRPTSVAFHDKTRYPLRGQHVGVDCAKCHDPKKPAAKRYKPLPHDKCLDCHADPHLGQTTGTCERCHAVDGWQSVRFEAADHAKTEFPLDGAHRAVPCGKCHPAAPQPPGFNAGKPACETCHADPHGGQFKGKGTCESCHRVAAWAPSTFGKDAHAKAGMPLVGEHDVACARCHAAGAAGAPTRFVDLDKDCATCHADRHAGQFAGKACTTCHAGAAWKPTPGFDHAKTDFALRGQHKKADCKRCHPTIDLHPAPSQTMTTEVYVLGKTTPACADCHRAQHGDPKSPRAQPRQLAARTRACGDCHDENRWAALAASPAFDHASTGAPLVGGHATAACAGCHQGGRALPPITECASCHEDRHGGRLGNRCESCHGSATWKVDQLLVDHQRTRLPLVGAHAVQGCPTCHKDAARGDYRGLDPSCRGCHWDTVIDRRPHPAHDGAAFLECENCHSALGWRPARIDHDRYWPLTGAHQSAACSRCHAPGEPYSAAPTQCIDCHRDDLAVGQQQIDHTGFGDDCSACHNTTTWEGATFDHSQFFPLRGPHNVACNRCHTTPGMNQSFSCTSGGCHPRTQTDNHHDEVGGYSYDSQECYRCHRNGGGGD